MLNCNFVVRRAAVLLALSSFACLSLGAASPLPEMPETLPACGAPQPYNVPQSLGNSGSYSYGLAPAIVWNGTDYASLVYNYSTGTLRFQHLYADGSASTAVITPISLPLGVSGYLYSDRTGLIWNGTNYAAVWVYHDNGPNKNLIAFALLNPDGTMIGQVQRASFIGATTPNTYDSSTPAVTYNASLGNYLVVWSDRRSGNADIYATVFNGTGVLYNPGGHDILMSRDGANNPLAGDQVNPRTAASAAGSAYSLVVWQDSRAAITQIYGRTLNLYTDGTPAYVGGENQMTSAASGGAFNPALTATANSYGLAWQDTRNGGSEIYAARLDGYNPYRTSGETRVTNTGGSNGYNPSIAWTGSEFGVGFDYLSGGSGDLWFARLSATAGAVLGSPVQITTGWTGSFTINSEISFGKNGFVATLPGENYAGHFAVAVGCNNDSTAPACPSSVAAAPINSTAATLSWLPVADAESETAYYQIYRNGLSVGKTSATRFTLTGLAPGSQSDFSVATVDADQRQQPSCPQSVVTQTGNLCTSAGALSAPQPLGAQGVNTPNAIVWNGTNFATAYADNNRLVMQKFNPNGEPASLPVTLATNVYNAHGPALVWNGSGYAVAWYATDGKFYLQRLNPDGSALAAAVAFDATTVTPYYFDYWQIALSWSGSKYAATWFDNRNSATTGVDVYATIFNSDGTVAGPTNNYFAIPISTASGAQFRPAIVWSPGIAKFLVAFEDDSTAVPSIAISQLDPATGTASAPIPFATPTLGGAFRPALTSDGYYPVIAWQDSRDTNGGSEIYASTLASSGVRYYGYDTRVTNDPAGSYNAGLSYAGNGIFYVYWNDYRGGSSQLWMQRINYQFPQGLPTRLEQSPVLHLGRGAASAAGHLVTATRADNTGLNYLISVGCLSDTTPPTCPVNIQASGVTQTEATLGWQPASDAESGVLAYNVYRDSTLIAQTQATTYTDAGLAAGGSYAYMVQPVNGAELANTGCTQTVSVNTPAGAGACNSGQTAAALRAIGGASVPAQSMVVFNGTEYAVVYGDLATNHLYFRRLYADGSPIAPAVDLGLDFVYYAPGLLWNGTGYAVSWLGVAGSGGVQFALLSPTGAFTFGPVTVSAPLPYVTGYGTVPVAFSGSGYAIAWNDSRNTGVQNYDIYATLLNADGSIAGAGAYHDLAIGTTTSAELFPTLGWSPTALRYLLAFEENSVSPAAIYRSLINPATGTFTAPTALITSSGGAFQPRLAADPYGYLLVWGDGRNNNTDTYFVRVDGNGNPYTTQTKANTGSQAYEPFVVWNGQEFGVFWNDGAGDGNNIWYQRVSSGGAAVGGNIQATSTADLRRATAAFGSSGYLVTGQVYNNGLSGANYAASFGCTADATAPTCPGNLLAYNVSGTQATLAWLPGSDPESGISHYQVYQNNAVLAQTAATTFQVTGLTQLTPYNFAVLPINGRGVMNTACTASVYVKTTNAVTLTLAKSSPDATLNWTNAGLNNYSIFRGTSPNVMSQIGATPNLTAPDPNVLADTNSYFYTVDDPGQ